MKIENKIAIKDYVLSNKNTRGKKAYSFDKKIFSWKTGLKELKLYAQSLWYKEIGVRDDTKRCIYKYTL